ncbi:MAG: hypothetical protein ACYDEV_02930 [Acidiferrobacter sp.]
MANGETTWQSYERVATDLLNEWASHFGLGRVEGKQLVSGLSGATWEIDAKGFTEDGEGFLIVECRRHTTSKLNQESLAALAYRILDTGAAGGIIVSPLDLQVGANLVANHANIKSVRLDQNSTTTTYVAQFLGQVFVGFTEAIKIKDSLSIEIIRDGKVVDKRHYNE